MNKNFKRILTCTMAAIVVSAASAMPVNTVTAYAPKPDTVFVSAESVSISKSEIAIGKGETYNLNSTVYPLNVSNKCVLWLTSNPNVAYVDGSGKVDSADSLYILRWSVGLKDNGILIKL